MSAAVSVGPRQAGMRAPVVPGKIYAPAPSKRTIPATEGSDINSDLMKLISVVYGTALLVAGEDALAVSNLSSGHFVAKCG